MDEYIKFGYVYCPVHGNQLLTEDEYDRQMFDADDLWRCPKCNRISEWIEQDNE